MNIITGYRGEPHITSDQDRAKNQGAFGTGSYILDVGDQFAAQVISANEVRIRDGVLSMQGCVANIPEGAYDTCEISNGTQGMQRRDLIVARYTKNSETNIEDISLVVIEGTPASSSPSDPSYNTGDIQQGDSPVDFPLYRVNISGITISGTTLLAPKLRTQAETDTLLGSSSISNVKSTITGAIGNTPLGTTATTLSGAIAEHESDISTLNSNLAQQVTDTLSLQQDTFNSNVSTVVYKAGRTCFITCVVGQWYCSAGGTIRYGSASGPEWVISVGFRPKSNVEIREAFGGKRITVNTDGTVTCSEALSGTVLRFSGAWINA